MLKWDTAWRALRDGAADHVLDSISGHLLKHDTEERGQVGEGEQKTAGRAVHEPEGRSASRIKGG